MPLRICYVDESYDEKLFCLSALSVRHTQWKECYERLREFRQQLNREYGLLMRKEIHANDFLAGRGRTGRRPIPRGLRVHIVRSLLNLVAGLPSVVIFNVCLQRSRYKDPQMEAWDRLVNRLQKALSTAESDEIKARRETIARIRDSLSLLDGQAVERWAMEYKPRAMIIADEGHERQIEQAIRRMHVFNPIPSAFGNWGDGSKSKNFTIDHIIEDPIFKSSARSLFIQAVDCVAYSLLKRETVPSERTKRYDLHKMFDASLRGVCFTKASKSDALGIVRK